MDPSVNPSIQEQTGTIHQSEIQIPDMSCYKNTIFIDNPD